MIKCSSQPWLTFLHESPVLSCLLVFLFELRFFLISFLMKNMLEWNWPEEIGSNLQEWSCSLLYRQKEGLFFFASFLFLASFFSPRLNLLEWKLLRWDYWSGTCFDGIVFDGIVGEEQLRWTSDGIVGIALMRCFVTTGDGIASCWW